MTTAARTQGHNGAVTMTKDPIIEARRAKYSALSPRDRIAAEWADNLDGCREEFKLKSAYAGFRLYQIKMQAKKATA